MEQDLVRAFGAVVIFAGFGGLLGGMLAGRRAGIVGSILLGIIGGVVAAVIAEALNAAPVVDVEGYSLLYAAGGGLVAAWIIGASTR